MISEDVDIRDAEHGVSPILLRCSRVPVICEWRPEAAAEAAPKLQWPRRSIQRKDASPCPSPLFLYVTVYQVFEEGEMEVGTPVGGTEEDFRGIRAINSFKKWRHIHLYLYLERGKKIFVFI